MDWTGLRAQDKAPRLDSAPQLPLVNLPLSFLVAGKALQTVKILEELYPLQQTPCRLSGPCKAVPVERMA